VFTSHGHGKTYKVTRHGHENFAGNLTLKISHIIFLHDVVKCHGIHVREVRGCCGSGGEGVGGTEEDTGGRASRHIGNNLALTYWNQGKLPNAVELKERVLEAQRRILGKEHPDILNSITKLARIYNDLGRGTAAKLLMQQSVEASRKILGEDHISTIERKRFLDRLRLDHTTTEDTS
jgi:Tetratricopeptide repeat